MTQALAAPPTPAPAVEPVPALQQPQWHRHPAYQRTLDTLRIAEPVTTPAEIRALHHDLAAVSAGEAVVLQAGDCAESFHECAEPQVRARVAALTALAGLLGASRGLPVVSIGRIAGQFAKPRSAPTEIIDGVTLPSFRGHLVNSDVPTAAARRHDPRRMLWALQAARRAAALCGSGRPWLSHEALILDYERPLVRDGYLVSTHLPWIGERTRQPDNAHVTLLAGVANPVACKVGPSTSPADVARLCALLDPQRTPGRLTLIARMGAAQIVDALPPLVASVRAAGHPVVWLCDPMHGNTYTTGTVKTRDLSAITTEVRGFHDALRRAGAHPGGLHLETAATPVTECIGGSVRAPVDLARRYTSLCDPRLNPAQAAELIRATAVP